MRLYELARDLGLSSAEAIALATQLGIKVGNRLSGLSEPDAAALRKALPKENQSPFVHFILEKKTPAGAGLGGGSGNAAAALLALNRLCPEPQTHGFLEKVAGVVGSDCPLFIRGKPIVMRGRGEILEVLPMLAEQMITGRRVLIFKPSFGIPTAWAYGRMKEQAPRHYIVPEMADDILNGWLESPNPDFPLFNNMQGVAFEKYIALPALLNELKQTFKIPCLMSGSGSACFALPDENTDVAALRARVESAWGQGAWLADTVLR